MRKYRIPRMWFRVPARTSVYRRYRAGRSMSSGGAAAGSDISGIDAAMKSADVQLVTYVPPPSENQLFGRAL